MSRAIPRPIHVVVVGKPVADSCYPIATCRCEPVQCRSIDEPAQIVYVHRGPVGISGRSTALTRASDSFTYNESRG